MHEVIVGMQVDIAMLKTAFGNAIKVGAVAVVDADRGYRLDLGRGSDGEPYLSPWYPHPESGGQSRSWMPLSVGQVVGVVNPGGDPRKGLVLRGGYSGDHPPPSADLAANVLTAFGARVTMADGTITIDGDLRVNGRSVLNGECNLGGEGGVPAGIQNSLDAAGHPLIAGLSSKVRIVP